MTIYQTSGNPYGHIIMRGGKRPNYHAEDIAAAGEALREFDLPEQLVVDFSHGNCQKQHRRQLEVCADICQQIRAGSTAIAGIMAESFLQEGTQKVVPGQPLTGASRSPTLPELGRQRKIIERAGCGHRHPPVTAPPAAPAAAILFADSPTKSGNTINNACRQKQHY